MGSKQANAVDVHVGLRIRAARLAAGLSQERFGHELGVSFQQVQKYEKGSNRVGASRLYDLSRVLDVPVSFFFDDMAPAGVPGTVGLAEGPEKYEPDPMLKRETLELVRAYYKIADPHIRRRFFDLAKALAKSSDAG